MLLTHCGRVTQYGDGSMLCKNPIFFTMKNSIKFKILLSFESRHHHLSESIAKIVHFYILTLPGGGGGGHFDEKIPKNQIFKGCGEKMAITRLIIELAPWNYFHSKFWLKSSQNATLVANKIEQSSIFFATVVKIPPIFLFFLLKRIKFFTFNV